jgi:hypothetical protein
MIASAEPARELRFNAHPRPQPRQKAADRREFRFMVNPKIGAIEIVLLYDGLPKGSIRYTQDQAENFARKLVEALDRCRGGEFEVMLFSNGSLDGSIRYGAEEADSFARQLIEAIELCDAGKAYRRSSGPKLIIPENVSRVN